MPSGVAVQQRQCPSLSYVVRIKGSGAKEAVMTTAPNFYNVSRPLALKPTLIVE